MKIDLVWFFYIFVNVNLKQDFQDFQDFQRVLSLFFIVEFFYSLRIYWKNISNKGVIGKGDELNDSDIGKYIGE